MTRIKLLVAAGSAAFLAPIAASAAMSPQPVPRNSDGTSRIADPDEALERMVARRTDRDGRVVRTYSDSSSDARDMVRSHVDDSRHFPR